MSDISQEKKYIDNDLFNIFKDVGSLAIYTKLDGYPEFRQKQKEKFFQTIRDEGNHFNPTLDYPMIDLEDIFRRIEGLENLSNKVLGENLDGLKHLYSKKIDEKILDYKVLYFSGLLEILRKFAEKEMDSDVEFTDWKDRVDKEILPKVKDAETQKFITKCIQSDHQGINLNFDKFRESLESYISRKQKDLIESVYGKPNLGIFYYCLKYLIKKIEKIKSLNTLKTDSKTKELLNKLRKIIDRDVRENRIDLPQKDDFVEYRDMVTSQVRKIFQESLDSKNKIFNSRDIKIAFENALDLISHNNEWNVVIEENTDRSSIVVDKENKQILIPVDRKLDKEKLEQIIVHEIGTHVKRFITGSNTKLRLLSIGLDKTELAEEGIAKIREALVSANEIITDSMIENYLAIGFAYGLDGKKRDFRETFQIMIKIDKLFRLLKRNEIILRNNERLYEKIWKICVRIFRGTICRERGVIFTKDKSYLEGVLKIGEFIKKNSNKINHLTEFGKFDPTNEDHVKILRELEIII